MTPETLHRLLADHTLDALPEDTTALLHAYLAHDPAAQKESADLRALTTLARRALAEEIPAPLPLPPLTFPRPARPRLLAFSAAASAMAACLALGFWYGAAQNTAPSSNPIPSPPAQIASTPDNTAPAPGGGVQNFWSTARLRTYAAQHPTPEKPAPVRKSFSTLGQLGA